MMRVCQHKGCGAPIHEGSAWCQSCIEFEWPSISLSDGKHWLVHKVATQNKTDPGKNVFRGAYGCPYKKGEDTVPLTSADWLCSPLGALKESVVGANRWQVKEGARFILSGVVRSSEMMLVMRDSKTFYLRGRSPARIVAAQPIEDLSVSPHQARAWLDNFALFEREILAFEQGFCQVPQMREELPPALAAFDTPVRAEQITLFLKTLPPVFNWYLDDKYDEIMSGCPLDYSSRLRWNDAMHLQSLLKEFVVKQKNTAF